MIFLGSIITVTRKNWFKFGHGRVYILNSGATFNYITTKINDIIYLIPCKEISDSQTEWVIYFSKNFWLQWRVCHVLQWVTPLPPVLVPQSFTIFTGSAVLDVGEKDVLVGSANQIFPVYSRKSRRDIPQYVPPRHENTSMGLNIYSIYQIFNMHIEVILQFSLFLNFIYWTCFMIPPVVGAHKWI